MKKLLSVLLVVLMLVGMLPMNAIHTHAAETTETLNIYGSTGTKTSDSSSISWTSNGVTFTNAKASSSTAIRTSDSDHYRLYAGSSVTVSAPGNITKIVVTCTSSSYATVFNTSATDNGDAATVTTSGSTVTIVPTASASSYTISKMSAQARISKVAVTYAAATAACEHTNTTETTENATCTAAGSTKVVCDDCGETVSETEIPALGHNYELSGTTYTCSNCGDSYETFFISFSVPDGVTAIDDMEYTAGGIKLPTAGVPTGDHTYTFAGWTTGEVDNETAAPTIYKADETFTATTATTLYALYTYSVAGEGGSASTEYVLTDIANIKATDEVVIVGNNGSYYAMSNDKSTSAPTAVSVTVSNGKITSNVPDNIKWNIVLDGSNFTVYPNGSTTTWLYNTAANNGVKVGTGANNVFKIGADDYIQNTATSRFLGIYNSQDWRSYTTGNSHSNIGGQTFGFYVKSSGASSTTYYTTVISGATTECTHENTTETTVDATCTVAGSTTVTCDDCGAEISKTEIPATGEHTYVDGVCTVCGAEEPSTSATVWQLVTDASTLAAGDRIVIVSKDADVALSTTQNNNNRAEIEITKDTTNNTVGVVDGVQIITLEKGTTDGTFAFYVEGDSTGYLYAASSGSNYLRTESTLSDNSSWLITIASDGVATVKAQGTNSRNWLRYNSTSSIFSCYASGQDDILIYKETVLCEHANIVDVAEVPATCTSVGYTAGKQCTECGVYTEGHEEIPALGHSYDDGVVTTAPGCTTTGVKTFTCSACGNTYTETVAATGHLNTTETTVDATCTVAGSTTVTCDDCGAVISSTTIPAGHSWDEGKVTTEATCEEPGVTTYTCSVCKETKTEEIVALGHNWDEGEVTTAATCDTDGVMFYTCQNDNSHTKTEAIPATGHSYVNGVCSVCQKEISRFQLVTDYTQILAGGEYIIAAKVGDDFYAIDSSSGSWLDAYSVTVTGSGADMMVVYADGLPIWNVEYFLGRNNCFSLYSPAASQYLKGTESTSLGAATEPWAWTFIDGSNSNGGESDGTFAVTQEDGSVAFVAASATVIDRAISLKNTTEFTNYSVRTSGYNRELYFFKLVEANETEYTVKFVENGITTITQSVPVDENVLKMPQPTGAAMPEGYTKFVGWVELPHTESLVAPTTIYSAEEIDGANNTVAITEDKTFYALYSREDPDAEGQSMSYHRVTDTNQLVVGEKYIIVGLATDGGYWAMSKDQLSDDRGASLVVPDENGVITFLPEDNVAVFELAQGHEIGSFAFLDLAMNMFLYCSSSDSNASLKSQATLNSAASFVIDILKDANTGYYSAINANVSVNRSYLMFNTIRTEDRLFSSYALYADSDTEGNLEQNTFLYVGVPNSVYATYYTTGLCNHEWFVKESQTASCTQPGYTMYACSICGEIKMEDVQAHGHTIGSSVTTLEPTCTTTGTATATCTDCGAEFTDVIPALGHTEVVDAAVAATCTETGWTEGSHCSVCSQIIAAQQVAPALGHDFDATKGVVDEETEDYPVVIYPCSRCEEKHIAAQLKFTNASLTLQNNIVVNFKAPSNVMGEGEYAGFSDLRAEFTYGNRVDENMIKATSAEIVQQTDGKYSVPCRRVTPSQIGDKITATLYGTYEGKEYSFTMTYSAAEYCYTMLGTTTDTELQTLLVNLLYYCDAAREYTTYQGVDVDYKYYGSVTEDLTDAQEEYRTVSDKFTSVMGLSGEGEFAATWKSASLILGEATSIRFRVDLGEYDIDAVTVKATVGGKDYTDISVKQDGETYLIQIDGISAHRMRETVEVTLYSGETVISKTVSYSIESYVANKMSDTNEKLVNMLIAMMSYGDAAAAYNA